jgi:hypothetical protein
MWTDISQYDIPEHQKTASYGSGKEDKFTEIGEVCVVNSMFGKAKIRVIQPRKKRRILWPLTAFVVTGTVAIVWLEQDTPKPPEPMRIIVRSVDSEGSVQTSSQQLKGTPPLVGNALPPAVPLKPQTSSGLETMATVVTKPVIVQPALPLVKSEPAKTVPATNPLTPVKPPAAIQPASAQAATPVMKSEKPVTSSITEPLPENKTKIPVPPTNVTPPGQTSTQSN